MLDLQEGILGIFTERASYVATGYHFADGPLPPMPTRAGLAKDEAIAIAHFRARAQDTRPTVGRAAWDAKYEAKRKLTRVRKPLTEEQKEAHRVAARDHMRRVRGTLGAKAPGDHELKRPY